MKILFALTLALLSSGVTMAETNVVARPNVGEGTNAVAKAKSAPKAERPARITAAKTYYDRKEGFALFSGSVHVDDVRYQLHADKAYVFMGVTNELKRIVAMGHVAVTNENKRAYGAKASYYRDHGMVVLYSGDGRVAEVREEASDGNRVVRGSKIKFWIDSEQVEVVDATITAPPQGKKLGSGTMGILGK